MKKFRLSQGMNGKLSSYQFITQISTYHLFSVIVSQIPFEFHLRLLDAVSLEGLNERFVFITTDWWDINSIPSVRIPHFITIIS